MISTILLVALSLGGIALLITAALSPIETLSWWAGWTEEEIDEESPPHPTDPAPAHDENRLFVVYLSGIASLSGRFILPREKAFIKGLEQRFPEATIIDDVFPYSPAGLPLLASPRLFDRVWRFVQRIKLEGRSTILSMLINMRNIFQVMISADHRYGPIFNQGAATVIEAALLRAGYEQGSRAPITIIGYSGGGQVAIGASTFLKNRLGAPIDVISIGGVMASDPGLHFLRRLTHIRGAGDRFEKIGAIVFPERWSVMAHSEWNAAKRDGRITIRKMEPMSHAGIRGYFGLVKFDGITNNERTLDEVTDILSTVIAPSTAQ